MKHILDNPVWQALVTRSSHLGHSTEKAAYFEPAVSPFVALATPVQTHLQDLHEVVPFDDTVVFVTNKRMGCGPWEELTCIDGFQLIYHGPDKPATRGPEPTRLEEEHIPQMLALTQLTNPGPFLQRTIDFGHYEGIFEDGKLISMAGQRLHVNGFAEISAVCTHPDYLGKGYARHLVLRQVNRIQAVPEIPFLHVKAENVRAIKVYESLGFEIRTEIFFYVLKKAIEA